MLSWLIKVTIGLFLSVPLFGQNDSLLLHHIEHEAETHEYKPFYMFKNARPIVKYNPLTMIPGGLMYAYQKMVSPQIFANCMYEVSCSKFSIKLISNFGFLKGVALSADRLTRCTRLSAEDISPLRVNRTTGLVKDEIEWYHKHP